MPRVAAPLLACLFIIAVCGCGDSGNEALNQQYADAENLLDRMAVEYRAMDKNLELPDSYVEIDHDQLAERLQWDDDLLHQFIGFATEGTDRQRKDSLWVLGRARRSEGLSVIIEGTKDDRLEMSFAAFFSLEVYADEELSSVDRRRIVNRLTEIVDIDPMTLNDAEAALHDPGRSTIMQAFRIARRAQLKELEPFALRHYESGVFEESQQKFLMRFLSKLSDGSPSERQR